MAAVPSCPCLKVTTTFAMPARCAMRAASVSASEKKS